MNFLFRLEFLDILEKIKSNSCYSYKLVPFSILSNFHKTFFIIKKKTIPANSVLVK